MTFRVQFDMLVGGGSTNWLLYLEKVIKGDCIKRGLCSSLRFMKLILVGTAQIAGVDICNNFF